MSENRKIKFTTNKGVFVAEMFEDKAPLTTKNFIELVEKGFYDGIIFHRVIDGFMIQGGDPTGTGMGGPGYKIKDEFGEGLKHDDEGILSMANAGPNTGGSQFFITLAPTPWLNGHHAIFGKVVEGMDVVRLIGVVPTDFRDRPREAVTMEKVEVVKKMAAFVYMLRCKDGSLYTGWTNDLEHRLAMHNSGRGAKYTRGRGPLELVYSEELPDKEAALRRECAIKKLRREQKLALLQTWQARIAE